MMSTETTPMEVLNDQASSGAMCICGNPECENSLDQTQLEGLPLFTHQHRRRLHGALKSQDCGTVCQLLLSGMQLCTSSEDNCFVHIVKYCTPSFLDSALKMKPEAVNARGPDGLTLLMLCDSVEKMQVLLKYGPDLDAVNQEGDTVLLHFVKHTLRDVVQEIMDSFNELLNNVEFNMEDEDLNHKNKVQNMMDGCKSMLQIIVNGENVNAEDAFGSTALNVMLNYFKKGYVFCKTHYDTTLRIGYKDNDAHLGRICTILNEIAAQALSTLLQAEPVIPGANEHGTTALMRACLSPWNIDNIQLLVQRGVDVNEEDIYGHNASHYLLTSFVYHYCYIECLDFSDLKAAAVDEILSFLLDSGCELQGTDILMFELTSEWYTDEEFPVLLHLMSLKDSCLNKRDFPGKQALKNSKKTCSFLEKFLDHHKYTGWDCNTMQLDLKDVDLLSMEIAAGLDVQHRAPLPWDRYSDQKDWSAKLIAPDALRKTVHLQVVDGNLYNEPERTERGPEYFTALDEVQRLLLPFWPHPPLALLIFAWYDVHREKHDVALCMKQVQFLYDVGGPLTRGSELYHATRLAVHSAVQTIPGLQPVLDTFDQLHVEIPSLLQMSRTALRASLKEVDTKGLDFSHLKVWSEGELRSIPAPILKFLNFVKSPSKPAVSAAESSQTCGQC